MTIDHGTVRVFLVQHTGKWAEGDPNADFTAVVKSLYPGARNPRAGVPINSNTGLCRGA